MFNKIFYFLFRKKIIRYYKSQIDMEKLRRDLITAKRKQERKKYLGR